MGMSLVLLVFNDKMNAIGHSLTMMMALEDIIRTAKFLAFVDG